MIMLKTVLKVFQHIQNH